MILADPGLADDVGSDEELDSKADASLDLTSSEFINKQILSRNRVTVAAGSGSQQLPQISVPVQESEPQRRITICSRKADREAESDNGDLVPSRSGSKEGFHKSATVGTCTVPTGSFVHNLRHTQATKDAEAAVEFQKMPSAHISTKKKQQLEKRQNQGFLENQEFVFLRAALCAKHGTLLRAWRRELDPDCNLFCTSADLQACVQLIEYKGDVEALCSCLTNDTLTLLDLDPRVNQLVLSLRDWVQNTFGGPSQMFDTWDTSGDGMVEFSEFCEGCRGYGFRVSSPELRELFEALDLEASGLLTKDEFLVLESDPDERKAVMTDLRQRRSRSKRQHAGFLEHKEVSELRQCLCSKHGSLLRAWRFELDPDGDLECHFREFCAAAKNLNYHRDVLELFRLYEGQTVLRLSDIDGRVCHLLVSMRHKIKEKFGGPMEMFEVFDASGDGQLSFAEFSEAMQTHNFKYSDDEIHELFEGLDLDNQGLVSEEEFIVLEEDATQRQELFCEMRRRQDEEKMQILIKMHTEHGGKDMGPLHRLTDRPWNTDVSQMPLMILQNRQRWRHRVLEEQSNALRLFKKHLRATYGNEIRAWRRALDPDDTYAVTKQSITKYVHQVLFEKSPAVLWAALNTDHDGSLSLEEFVPQHAKVLARFMNWATKHSGNCYLLWATGAFRDAEERGGMRRKLRCHDFWEALGALGFHSSAQDRRLVTSGLDYHGCGFIRLRDLAWLDGWEPPSWLTVEPDKTALDHLRKKLLATYGNFIQAWRRLLDVDGSNRVSWGEFENACRRLKWNGNVAGAWRCLDDDLSGWISLNEIDQESHELLSSFKNWCERNFGSVTSAFKELDKDKSGGLTFSEVRKSCKQLAWTGNPRLLFDSLDTSQNPNEPRRAIKLNEIAFLDDYHDDVVDVRKHLKDEIDTEQGAKENQAPSAKAADSPASRGQGHRTSVTDKVPPACRAADSPQKKSNEPPRPPGNGRRRVQSAQQRPRAQSASGQRRGQFGRAQQPASVFASSVIGGGNFVEMKPSAAGMIPPVANVKPLEELSTVPAERQRPVTASGMPTQQLQGLSWGQSTTPFAPVPNGLLSQFEALIDTSQCKALCLSTSPSVCKSFGISQVKRASSTPQLRKRPITAH